MTFRYRFVCVVFSVALLSGMFLSAAEESANSSETLTALEKYYGGHVERAKREGKDLLIVLYNSQRLTPEKKAVMVSPPWREKVLSRVILIEIDTRDEITKDPEAVVPMEALLQQFQLNGGPAFMALDTKGQSFGQVSFKTQTADEIVRETEALFTAGKQRDEAFAKAADLEVQQVKVLDLAVDNLLKSRADLSNYRNLIDKLIELDEEDKAGVKAKYRALAGLFDAVHLLLTNHYEEGMKLMRSVDGDLLPETLKRDRDQRLIRMYFLTNRPDDAENYVKEVLSGKNIGNAYKQELSAFLATRFKADQVKSLAWYKLALSFGKDGPEATDIVAKMKALDITAGEEVGASAAQVFKTSAGTLDLAAMKGKSTAVLLFWNASYKASLATLAELTAEYKGSDVVVYAINVGDSEENVKAYANKAKLEINWAFDTERAGADQFGLQHFPTLLLIGKDGKVKHSYLGLSGLNKDEVKKDIEALRK